MKPIDLRKLLQKHTSGWVAVSTDYKRVVAHSEKFIDLQKKVKNNKNIIVVQAFPNYFDYVS